MSAEQQPPPAAAAEQKEAKAEATDKKKDEWQGGELLFAGGTDWAMLGRTGGGKKDAAAELQRQERYPNLVSPHKLAALEGVRIAFVAAGSTAVHCIAGAVDGTLYTWGRNERGQLGHGDLAQRNAPTAVAALSGRKVVAGGGGKHHSLFVLEGGEAWAAGLNTQGQLGTGSIRKAKGAADDIQALPVRSSVSNVASVAAGADFSAWLTRTGELLMAGNPQYGQLGDGSDHVYNAKDSSIKLVYEPQPTPKAVAALLGTRVARVACGQSHTIALDDKGGAFTWGSGDYGKLGHRVQQDEHAPRVIESFRGRIAALPDGVVAAGGTSTFCVVTGPQLMGWGKLKVSGDNTTHPMPVEDLSGWNLRSMACGPGTFAVAADRSVITWGAASNGELGYGPDGKKTSARPDKCLALEDAHTHQVACGNGFTLFLVEPGAAPLGKLQAYSPAVLVEEAKAAAPSGGGEDGGAGSSKGGAKRKGGGGGAAGGRGKKAAK